MSHMFDLGAAMRVIILGMGVQGVKRKRVAGGACVGNVDPVKDADYKVLDDVPLESYDAALCCTPDSAKYEIVKYCLENSKHVFVEKPLWFPDRAQLIEIVKLAKRKNVVCYTAYNHRFEPHIARIKTILDSGELGRVYSCRLFYGNGTARQVRDSVWRDTGSGVWPDLGSHLLDICQYWFPNELYDFKLLAGNRFENKAPDHVVVSSDLGLFVILEISLLSWRNAFSCNIFAERGSLHVDSLCKWGPATLTVRSRVLPSGRPPEEQITLVQEDPTWALEYAHFQQLCAHGGGENDLDRALWIDETLRSIERGLKL